jgi:hypothetical protein
MVSKSRERIHVCLYEQEDPYEELSGFQHWQEGLKNPIKANGRAKGGIQPFLPLERHLKRTS